MGKQKVVHFELERACVAEVWVKDEQGIPIEKAHVKVLDLRSLRSTAQSRSDGVLPTNEDGCTLIGGHPRSESGYLIIVTHTGETGRLLTSSQGPQYHESKLDYAPAQIVMNNQDPHKISSLSVILVGLILSLCRGRLQSMGLF